MEEEPGEELLEIMMWDGEGSKFRLFDWYFSLQLGDILDGYDSYIQEHHSKGKKYWYLRNPFAWKYRVIETFRLVPIITQGKAPVFDGWRETTWETAAEVSWRKGANSKPWAGRPEFLTDIHKGCYNLGIIMGKPSGVFVVV